MDAHASPSGTTALNAETPRNGGHPRDPEEIRRDIARTREELGETVAALAEKADVKARARERVQEIRHNVSDRTGDVAGKVRGATPDSATHAAGQVTQKSKEHPFAVFVALAIAAGFIVGRLTARH